MKRKLYQADSLHYQVKHRQTQIKFLKDNAKFRIGKYSQTWYRLQSQDTTTGLSIITSQNSKRTYSVKTTTNVFTN